MSQTQKPASPLRQRMIDDMTMRKLKPKTQIAYIRAVRKLAQYLGRSPDSASADDLRGFQLHLVEGGVSSVTLNATITGLKFFFEVTLSRRDALAQMSHVHEPRKLPVVLSAAEVEQVIDAAGSLKYQAALSVAYGAGLRASQLRDAHQAGKLRFFGDHQALADARHFDDWLKPLRRLEWVVYAKRPFDGPQAVLAYLSRYTHRVAIANSRLIAMDERGVTFKWKDYREPEKNRQKTMTVTSDEFIRRFLIHILPQGFHRIRHYGLLANARRKDNLARARELLMGKTQKDATNPLLSGADNTAASDTIEVSDATYVCPDCGAPMVIIETIERGQMPRAPPVNIAA